MSEQEKEPGEPAGTARKNAPETRGRPFQKGNQGRPRGSRNKVSVMVERLIAKDAKAITHAMIEKAKGGNTTAGAAILRVIIGPAKERAAPIQFELPPLKTASDAMLAISAIAAGVADGSLDSEAAKTLTSIIGEFRAVLEAVDHEARLAELESRYAQAKP
jgi:hypothetical protein